MARVASGTSNVRFSFPVIAAGALAILFVCSLAIRWAFIHYESVDYVSFIAPWYTTLHTEGFGAFAKEFSNYNFPYLYLLYFSTLFPIPAIIAVKALSIVFDFVLAFGVYLVVKKLRSSTTLGLVAGVSALFLPTVIINSAAWAQCDAIFTSMLVFAFYFLLGKRYGAMWLFWGIAFAFKLQAVFVLPVLVVGWVVSKKTQKWYTPAIALVPFVVSLIPALFAGRSIQSALSIYLQQQGTYQHLTLNAANLYQWLDDSLYSQFNKAGLVFTVSVLTGLMVWVIARCRTSSLRPFGWLVFITLVSFIVPFMLPQMHERYFYPAVIFSLILAFQSIRLGWVVITAELISVFSSIPFLFGIASPIPLSFLSFVHLLIILVLLYTLHTTGFTQNKTRALHHAA